MVATQLAIRLHCIAKQEPEFSVCCLDLQRVPDVFPRAQAVIVSCIAKGFSAD